MNYKVKLATILLISILFFGLGVIVTYLYINNSNQIQNSNDNNSLLTTNEDSTKFKVEYESLNNILDENGENKYLNIEVPESNQIIYATINDIQELFNNKSGVIYFGFSSCPWCRNLVPVLLEAATEEDIDTIYYMDIKDMRDIKEIDDTGTVITKKDATNEYKTLLKLFNTYLDSYVELNDDTIKRIYAPTVFIIKNGEVIFKHVGTLDSQEDPKIELTSNQKLELKSILKEGLKNINQNNLVCDEEKNC